MGLLDKAKALYSKLSSEAETAMNTAQKTNTSANKTTTTTKTSAAGSSASNPNNKVTTSSSGTKSTGTTSTGTTSTGTTTKSTGTTTKTTSTPTTTTNVTTAKTVSTPTTTTATAVTTPSAISTTGTTKTSSQNAGNSSSIGSWKTPTYDDDDYYNATTTSVSKVPASQGGSSASNPNNTVETPVAATKDAVSQLGSSSANPNNTVSSGTVSSDSTGGVTLLTKDQFTNSLIDSYIAQKQAENRQSDTANELVTLMQSNGIGIPTSQQTASDLAYGTQLSNAVDSGETPISYQQWNANIDNANAEKVAEAKALADAEADAKKNAEDNLEDKGGVTEDKGTGEDTNKDTAGAYLGDQTADKSGTIATDKEIEVPQTVDDYAQLIMDIINGGGGTSDVATELSKYGITMPEAVAQAMESLIPSYRKSLQSTLNNLKKTALKGGFYGQLPAEALYQQAVASNESDMQQAIYDLALEIYNSAMENSLEAQEIANDTAESKIDMLMKLLEVQNDFSDRATESSGSGITSSTTYDNDGLSTTQIKAIEKGIGLTSQDGKYTDYVKEYAGGLSAKEAYTIYANAPTKTTADYSESQFTSALLLARQNGNLDSITDWLNENWSKISIKDRKTIQEKLSAATGQKYSVFAD